MPARKLLLAFGLVLFMAFLATGRHLMGVGGARPEDPGIRLLARANHVYLLFSSLLILAAALVESDFGPRWIRLSVKLGQVLVTLAAFPLLSAYFLEHGSLDQPRIWTQVGCVLSLAGTVLLGAKAFDRRNASPW